MTAPTNTQKHDQRANEFVCTPPILPPQFTPTCPPSPSPLKWRLHSSMKWKILPQVILRRNEGFNEQVLLYFVVYSTKKVKEISENHAT